MERRKDDGNPLGTDEEYAKPISSIFGAQLSPAGVRRGERSWDPGAFSKAGVEGTAAAFRPWEPAPPGKDELGFVETVGNAGSIFMSLAVIGGLGVGGYYLGEHYAPRGDDTLYRVGGALAGMVAGIIVNVVRNRHQSFSTVTNRDL